MPEREEQEGSLCHMQHQQARQLRLGVGIAEVYVAVMLHARAGASGRKRVIPFFQRAFTRACVRGRAVRQGMEQAIPAMWTKCHMRGDMRGFRDTF
jgi:hypothetical protein